MDEKNGRSARPDGAVRSRVAAPSEGNDRGAGDRGAAPSENLIDAMVLETERALAAVGLTHSQFVLLLAVSEFEPVPEQLLARILVVGEVRADGELAALYEKGLLCKLDEPSSAVRTTAHGRAILQRGIPLWDAAQRRIHHSVLRRGRLEDMVALQKKPAAL